LFFLLIIGILNIQGLFLAHIYKNITIQNTNLFLATPGKTKTGGGVTAQTSTTVNPIYIQSERVLLAEIFNLLFLINVMILTFIQEFELTF